MVPFIVASWHRRVVRASHSLRICLLFCWRQRCRSKWCKEGIPAVGCPIDWRLPLFWKVALMIPDLLGSTIGQLVCLFGQFLLWWWFWCMESPVQRLAVLEVVESDCWPYSVNYAWDSCLPINYPFHQCQDHVPTYSCYIQSLCSILCHLLLGPSGDMGFCNSAWPAVVSWPSWWWVCGTWLAFLFVDVQTFLLQKALDGQSRM